MNNRNNVLSCKTASGTLAST
ncbi:hypothetical protein F383_07641 [Gossypium arboreum]|uniref:Uncharacterized protein n=1 Tax=Gossypium arboreum TaxID=29729 RepID=A0A0B0PJ18_GOSAR|nr:hypothetical protein F383_07641 [Gossypium arboreum]